MSITLGGSRFIQADDSASTDAFGRWRTSEPFGIFDNKNLSTRNRNQWDEPISGQIITYTGLTLTFQAAEEIRSDGAPIAVGTINTDNGSSSMNIDTGHADFVVGDTITGQTSGATATIATVNTGSNVEYQYDRSSVFITAGVGATDSAARQTNRYHAYVPGKSQNIFMTFVLGESKANVRKRVGYFDSLNGVFLEQTNTDLAFTIRTSTSGSVNDTNRVTQDGVGDNGWNLDRLNGSGKSGINLTLSNTQIMVIDFQWLGVGRVRIGFDIDGVIVYAHEFRNANNLDVVFMKTPTLPIRYEIANTGVPASATTLEEICCSVVSEGGYVLPGLEFTADLGRTAAVLSTTLIPIFAIKLKDAFPAGEPNRRTVRWLNTGTLVKTNDVRVVVRHVHAPIDITATWNDVGGGSAVEYSTDISAVTGRPSHNVEVAYLPAGQGSSSTSDVLSSEFINQHGFISQNLDSDNSQMFVIYAQSTTGAATALTHITWVEFE